MLPLCVDQGVGVIPWSPLARGLLAGTRGDGSERRTVRSSNDPFADQLYGRAGDREVVARTAEVAAEHGVAPATVALAWLLERPGVTAPIIGATQPGHLADAVAALDLELSGDDVARLEEPYVPHPVLGHA